MTLHHKLELMHRPRSFSAPYIYNLAFSGIFLSVFTAATISLRAQQGGIEVFAGETLFEQGLRFSVTELTRKNKDFYRGNDKITDPRDRRMLDSRSVFQFDWGVDRDLTLTALLPYVYRRLRMSNPFVDQSAEGLGDIALLGKYRFLRREGNLRSSNLSLLLGLEVPTGSTRISDAGLRALPAVQPGTGALNPFVAISGTHGFVKTRIDATLFAKFNQEGSQGIQQGNFFAASLGIGHRFWMEKYPGATWAASLGLQWRHQSRGDNSGQLLTNSGFDQLLLFPKISGHPRPNLDLQVGLRMPLIQDYNGEQLGRGLEFILAFGFRF